MGSTVADRQHAIQPWSAIPRAGYLELLSDVTRVKRDMLGVVSDRYDRHGALVRQSQGPIRTVNLFGPDATRLMLLDREGLFSAKGAWDLIMGRIFSNGLLLRDGVDFHEDLFFRQCTVENLEKNNRQVRLFFCHDLTISGTMVGDSAYYEPEQQALFHYKGKCWFKIEL